MKYIKYFESENQFREIDLQLLWDDINKYHTKLFDRPVHTHMYFYSRLKQLLLDKEIEFNRVVNRFDNEVLYNFNGKVKEVKYDTKDDIYKTIVVELYKDKGKYPQYRNRDNDAYVLGTIDNHMFNKKDQQNKKPLIVKIYNSDKIEIEEKIDLLKIEDSYNL